ncbi:MAG: hypothetical protein KDA25_11175, partial [Phycisphaerales bacterium]|nr:hypothetical protein [Phycisphaerales bacterium]
MLDLPAIARLEEERIAVGVARVSDEAVPFAGGMMCFAGVGTWASQAYGVGMNGPVDAAEVDAMIDFYESRGCEPRVEVSAYAHQTLLDALAARSFVLREFASVLVRDL